MRFAAFEVKIGNCWLAVPQAEQFAKDLNLEFVHYVKINTNMVCIDAQRDAPSVQAIRNGMGDNLPREGIVLRPPIEVTKNNGKRIIAKHKTEAYQERTTHKKPGDDLEVLTAAKAIADEWCTEMRLSHVLQKLPEAQGMEQVKQVMDAMIEDITREAAGEIIDSKEARKAICNKTAAMFKNSLKRKLEELGK